MIVGEITVDEILEQLQKALDTNDLNKATMCAKDLGQFTSDSWSDAYDSFKERNRNRVKIEAVTAALRDLHRLDEIGNNELYYKLILERWEDIDNEH